MNGYNTFKDCVDACLRCAAICDQCAQSCTEEQDVKMMAACIRSDLECAAICYTTARLMSLNSSKAKEICRICADICEACGAECGKHKMDHCRQCTEACAACARECRKMAA